MRRTRHQPATYAKRPSSGAVSSSRQPDPEESRPRTSSPAEPVCAHATAPDDFGELVAAAQTGKTEALERLLAEARPKLLALAMRVLGDTDEAEDAVQDAMIKVWRNLGRFEGRAAFTTWLAPHRRQRRAGSAAPPRQRATSSAAAPEEHPHDAAERRRRRRDAGAHLRARRDRRRRPRRDGAPVETHGEALRLCDLEGESYATIATVTECPLGTVMSRLFHARRKLARELTARATERRRSGGPARGRDRPRVQDAARLGWAASPMASGPPRPASIRGCAAAAVPTGRPGSARERLWRAGARVGQGAPALDDRRRRRRRCWCWSTCWRAARSRRSVIASKREREAGQAGHVGRGRGGFGAIVLDDVVVAGAPGKPPLMTDARRPDAAGRGAGGRGPIRVDGLRIAAVKGGDDDNVSDIIDGLRGGKKQRQGRRRRTRATSPP